MQISIRGMKVQDDQGYEKYKRHEGYEGYGKIVNLSVPMLREGHFMHCYLNYETMTS